jgi:hypothetical protein
MAPQAFQAAKKIFLWRGRRDHRRHSEAFRKGAWQVIATHTMKTVTNSNQASSQSQPANWLSRSPSCTPSLAHAAAQRSF